LLRPLKVRVFAALKSVDPARAAKILARLKNWPSKAEFNKLVREFVTRAGKIDVQDRVEEALAEAKRSGRVAVNEGQPLTMANAFLEHKRSRLLHVDGGYLDYRNGAYSAVEKLTIRAEMQR